MWYKREDKVVSGRVGVGIQGEEYACRLLRGKGLRIIGRNVATWAGEIDIVARERDMLVFVEVRTRSREDYGTPEDSLNRRKRFKLLQNARAYVSRERYKGGYRIDAVCVVVDGQGRLKRCDHYEDLLLT